MTEDEERHADEVNIAFQMGADWERKQTRARIEKLEAALREIAFGYVDWKAPDISLEVAMDTARKALEGKDD